MKLTLKGKVELAEVFGKRSAKAAASAVSC
jgi:hypothetical protein